jgi:hypothetical protein
LKNIARQWQPLSGFLPIVLLAVTVIETIAGDDEK